MNAGGVSHRIVAAPSAAARRAAQDRAVVPPFGLTRLSGGNLPWPDGDGSGCVVEHGSLAVLTVLARRALQDRAAVPPSGANAAVWGQSTVA